MLEFKNFGQVFEAIDKWKADVTNTAEKYARGLSVSIFSQVLTESVQYSGDFAANWKYSLNTVDRSFTPNVLSGVVPHRSLFTPLDSTEDTWQAREIAVRNARGRDNGFKLGDTIYIANSAAHDEAYAVGIEQGTIKLRVPSTAGPLDRAMKIVLRASAGRPPVLDWGMPVQASSSGYKAVTRVTQLDSLRRRFKKHA